MADERVVIKIEVNSDDRAIDRTRRKLERLARDDRKFRRQSSRDDGLASRGNRRRFEQDDRSLNKVMRKYKKSFDSFDKMIKFTGGAMMKFLGMSAKMVALELVAMGAAMVGVHLIFGAGKLIMKGYHGAMKLVAGGMAGIAIAISTVAAALREQQAAMFAFSARGQAKEFGSGVNQARVQIRALTTDAELATVGVENLMAAYGAVTKTSRFTMGSQRTLKGLMDFAAAGQDLKTGTKAAGDFLAVLQDTKKSYSEVVEAGKKLSPQMKKALEEFQKQNKDATKESLTKAITSGELAKLGGVDGQFAAVSGTLISTLKGQFNLLRGLFADFGQQFLAPIKKESVEVFNVIKNALHRMSGDVAAFGMQGGMIDKISVVVEKISNWVVRLMRDYLPGTMGIFERIGDWWDRFVDGWNKVLDYLRPFIEGAKVIEGILKNAWIPIWNQIKEKMYEFNTELQKYQPSLLEFGTNIGNLVAKIMEYGSEVRKIFLEALPFINKVIKGFTDLLEMFTSFLGKFTDVTSKLGGGLGSMGSIMMLIGLARGMKNTKGYFTRANSLSGIREVADMRVNAQVININGKPIAQYGRAGIGGSSGVTANSNSLTTARGGPYAGPYMGRPGGGGGGGGGMPSTGLASRGAGGVAQPGAGSPRGRFIKTPYGAAQAGLGPNGGALITRGPNKGKEVLTQMVRGKPVTYMYDTRGPGFGPADRSQAPGVVHRSGVTVAASERMHDKGFKSVTAAGRIINRRERFARFFGEGQRHGATGFTTDTRMKNFADRMFGSNSGIGNRNFLGRMFDKYRDRQVANSAYLGPTGGVVPPAGTPPGTPPPTGTPPPARQGWLLRTLMPYGPGVKGGGLLGAMRNTSFYNNWVAPGTALKGPADSRFAAVRAFRNMRLNARELRNPEGRLGSAIFGNENRKGFQGSATGTMGTMLGLGMLANYASPEAQGFLSAGSMVGMMNPLAGLAIGLGGTALTSKTLGGGALSGAGAGAAIGTMIAPGVGTVVGGIIGAAVGGAMGVINKAKDEKKKVREAMEGMMNQVITDNLRLIQADMIEAGGVGKSAIVARSGQMAARIGDIVKLQEKFSDPKDFVNALYENRMSMGIDMSAEERDKMLKQPQEAAKYAALQIDRQDAVNVLTDKYSKRLKELTAMTGKSEQEVEKMAMQMGVNLYDATVDFNTVVQQLGINIVKTREQMRGFQMDLAIQGLAGFEKALDEIKAPEIIDEQARSFRDLYDSMEGAVGEKDFLEFAKNMIPNFLNYAGGGLQGMFSLYEQLGPGGKAFRQNEFIMENGEGKSFEGPFFGMESLFTTGPAAELFQKYMTDTMTTGAKATGGDLNAMLMNMGGIGQKYQVDAALFGSALADLGKTDPGKAMSIVSAIQDGTLFANYDTEKLTLQNITEILSTMGLNPSLLGVRAMAADDELNLTLENMPDDMKKTYEGVIALFRDFFTEQRGEKPEWMTEKFIKFIAEKSDTSSPRGRGIGDTTSSRLAETMSRHSAMNGMLTGKRTVTSAWRDWGLGSPSSDHIMGRAYDLTGQNLGGYAKLVRAGGGFAEFHGRNAGRHLHVVPGAGPYGDTASPNPITTTVGAPAGSTVINITQNIEGGPNASPEEIAKIAVTQMKLVLENERQRM